MFKRVVKQFSKGVNIVNINGTTYTSSKSITVIDGKVIIDGNDVTPSGKEINISIEGSVENLEVDACSKVTVNGNVKTLRTTSGDIDVKGNVEGSISTTSGDIDCGGNIGGDVKTVSGDVDCGKISGNVSSVSGDVKQRMF